MKIRFCIAIVFLAATVGSMSLEGRPPNLKPKLVVVYPRGFRFSIDHEDGIELFVFRGNINKPMDSKESEMFYKEVTQPRNNRWVFEDDHTVIEEGDNIFFKILVVKNLRRFSKSGSVAMTDTTPVVTTTERVTMIPIARTSTTTDFNPYHTARPDTHIQSSLELASSIYNTVENLTAEIKRHREINSILIELVEQNHDMARAMTFKGMLPPYSDDIYVAQMVIKDKLGLRVPVVSARKNSDGSVTFEVASINDKIQVIKSAKTNLKESKIQLVY